MLQTTLPHCEELLSTFSKLKPVARLRELARTSSIWPGLLANLHLAQNHAEGLPAGTWPRTTSFSILGRVDVFFRDRRAEHHSRNPHDWRSLPIQYADYAQWQRAWLAGDRLQRHAPTTGCSGFTTVSPSLSEWSLRGRS